MIRSALLALPLSTALLVSCAGPPPDRAAPTAAVEAEAPAREALIEAHAQEAPIEAPAHPIASLARAGDAGSGIALGSLAGKRLALVADEDDRAVHTVDLDARADLAVTPLGEAPSQIVIGDDGLVYVGLRSAAAVQILASSGAPGEPLRAVARLPTAAEPVGLTIARGGTLLVTTGITHQLAAFSLADRRSLFTVDLPREPRSIAVPGEGKQAFVSHAAGSLVSVVELASSEHRPEMLPVGAGLQPYSGLCAFPPSTRDRRAPPPQVRAAAMPGVQGFGLAEVGGTLYLPAAYVRSRSSTESESTSGYGPNAGFAEISRIAAVDPKKREVHAASLVIEGVQGEQCLLPRGVARNPTRKSLLVTCLGRDVVMEAMLRPDSANYDDPSGRVWEVPAGPTAIAVDEARREAVVLSQFDRAVSLVDLTPEKVPYWAAPKRAVVTIALRPLAIALDPAWAEGRRLFHETRGRRVSRDGRACASCHPDGRDDGLVWTTPHGLRQTPMLAGRLQDTAPYGWEGARTSLADHVTSTIAQRLQGTGLRSGEIDALAAYVLAMPAPARVAKSLTAQEARGQSLFRSGEVGCAGCHSGAALTDGVPHDVQSGGRFDTPSLRFLGATAPYSHDGRYPTLRALLLDMDGRMGRIGQLEDADLDALEAYLRTL